MNESKQITIENWQFSAVDSIQEFYLFIYLFIYYYHLFGFLEGGGITRLVSTEWYSRNLGLSTMQATALYFQPSQHCVARAAQQNGRMVVVISSIRDTHYSISGYGAFSPTWAAARQISWDKRKVSHAKKVQSTQDGFGTPTWPPFHWCWTPIWPTWRHVKHSIRKASCVRK